MANTWNQSGTTWGQNSYGLQTEINVPITGLSITSTVGSVESFNETGWGSDTWGFENWGESSIDVILSSLTATTSLNIPNEFISIKPGWGTLDWGENGWGTVESAVFNLTGLSATSSVGTLIAEDVMGLTGLSAESAVGSLSIKSDVSLTLSALSLTSSPGLLSVDDHSIGLPALSATSAVGSISPADVIGITAPSSVQTDVGAITISSNPVVDIVGVSASTSLGSLTIDNITPALLVGQSSTSAVGSLTTTQLSIASLVGLGQTATTSLNDAGIILQYYGRLSPKTSTGYSRKTPKDSTGYTRKTA